MQFVTNLKFPNYMVIVKKLKLLNIIKDIC